MTQLDRSNYPIRSRFLTRIRWPQELLMQGLLLSFALLSLVIVGLIFFFILKSAWPAFQQLGFLPFLTGTTWRPGNDQFGILAMIVGSLLVTLGAIGIGVPLAIGTAIVLAELAPPTIHKVLRISVELLAGIPSVVYGLFGMAVLVPLIRQIPVPGNTGFGLLSAFLVLAIMILPTITSITEDALRAVPRSYREASLALGTTRWQTIWNVLLPAAQPGIVAAVVLGIGRALGETMAMIMVIGNSVIIPRPLGDAWWTLFLSQARTLTGNIAVEIAYATGIHEQALFATGVVLFILIFLTNWLARAIIHKRIILSSYS